jgi:4-hydroxybenzoate polyprenyltransferase
MHLIKFFEYIKLIRIHQPTGIFLLLWPCLWGTALAGGIRNIKLVILFIIGSVIMRSAGCIINDIIDRDIDKKVIRTKDRPLARKTIKLKEALILLLLLLLSGAVILLSLHKLPILIALTSMILVVIYPFMKRITYWPQLFLGFTFNIGVLIGYSQIAGKVDLPAITLYIAGIFWTLGYDTIYGYQDITDDLKIGVKSSAIAIKKYPKTIIFLLYSLMIIFIIISLSLKQSSFFAYLFLLFPTILILWQISTLQVNNPQNCLRRFKANVYIGLLILGALSTVNITI